MIVLAAIGAVVLALLVAVATWMAIVGLMGAIGAVRFKRCRVCGHLRSGWSLTHPTLCAYCRHPWLVRHVMPVRLHHLLPAEMEPVQPVASGDHLPRGAQ